jgi:AAHS family 4-hydroxybenzoate transporter-like MFS transporter
MHFDWPAIFIVGGCAAIACILLTVFLIPTSEPSNVRHTQSPFSTLGKQFAEGRGPAAVMLWITAFCVMMVTYFMVSWTPTVLHLTGMDLHKADTASLSVNIGGILGALVIASLIGRRSPFVFAACFLLLGTLVVCGIGFSLNSTPLAVAAFSLAGFCVIGGQLILPAMAARLFPASVRGAGVGALMGIGRIGSIAGPMIGGMLIGMELPWNYMYLIAAVPVAVATLAIASAEILRPRELAETN